MDAISQNPALRLALVAVLAIIALALFYFAWRAGKQEKASAVLELEAGTPDGSPAALPATAATADVTDAVDSPTLVVAPAKLSRKERKAQKAAAAAQAVADVEAAAYQHPVVADSTYELDVMVEPEVVAPDKDEEAAVANVTRSSDDAAEVLLLDVVEVEDPFTAPKPDQVSPEPEAAEEPERVADEADVHAEATTDPVDATDPFAPLDLLEELAVPAVGVPDVPEHDAAPANEEVETDENASPLLADIPTADSPTADPLETATVVPAPDDADDEAVDASAEDVVSERWVYRPPGYTPPPAPVNLPAPAETLDDVVEGELVDDDEVVSEPAVRGRLSRRERKAEKASAKEERSRRKQTEVESTKAQKAQASAEAEVEAVRAAAEAEKAAARAAAVEGERSVETSPGADAVADFVIAKPAAVSRYDLPEPLPKLGR